MLIAIFWGGLAAASLLIGYILAKRGPSKKTTGIVMGIGAGALISAIAYELVPESVLTGLDVLLAFLLGALSFILGDSVIERVGGGERKDLTGGTPSGSGPAIFIGTLMDNVPESIILGMSMGLGGGVNVAFLASVFVSNLPEGVAGTLNLKQAGYSYRKIFPMWLILVILSAMCAGLGYLSMQWLPVNEGVLVQAFAAGAMLTMLADAMIPEAYEHGGKMVGLFTVFGFLAAALLSVLQ